MINIQFNENEMTLDTAILLSDLLQQMGCTNGIYAVSLNRHFIPRADHANTLVQAGDHVEIIMPMQGG